VIQSVRNLGFSALQFVEGLGRLTTFSGRALAQLGRPPLRFGVFMDELHKLGVLSLVIICVSGAAVGMVLSLQGYNTLQRFGATDSLGAVVGISLLRELGPVLTALLATGRAGSATTAEIGTMVATEQLDGLRMMAVDPMHLVVVPRLLAMVVVMPLLSALFIVCGMGGGYLVGVSLMGIDGGRYMSNLFANVDFHEDVVGSLVKAVVFGVVVGLISTWRGFTAKPTSAGVSAATTSTVVTASVTVLLLDYIVTALWGI
jgi:phospholipid/cholesterol/gamma-HCH transport system permease protein